MKKALILVLSLVLCLALAAPALAENVGVSQQTLKVDSEIYKCDKYNIDGSNYFKLRDLAYLLTGTGSQFSVGFDAASNTVAIETGREYQWTGKELLLGADASRTAQKSAQTILIDGREVADLNAYNIGGSNYFKLRDLGEALGFDVDFDAASNTALISSRPAAYLIGKYRETGTYSDVLYGEDGTETTVSGPYVNTTTYKYTDKGQLSSVTWLNERDGQTVSKSTNTYTYNPNGTRASATYDYGDGTAATESYDAMGNVVKNIYTYSDYDGGTAVETTTYAYNKNGYPTVNAFQSDYYSSKTTFSYDGRNNLLAQKTVDSDNDEWSTVYTYDAAGNCLTETYNGYNGYSNKTVRTFNAAGQTLTETVSSRYEDGDSYSSVTTYSYDANGSVIKRAYRSSSVWNGENSNFSYTCTYSYDANGRILTEETEYSDGTAEIVLYTYDGDGNRLTHSYNQTGPYGYSWNDVYSYDKDGNLIKTVETWDSGVTTYTYTYDAHGNKTKQVCSDGTIMTWDYIRF